MAELRERYDDVVIDSPAFGVVSDAMALVPLVQRDPRRRRDRQDDARSGEELHGPAGDHEPAPLGLIVTMTEKDRTQIRLLHRQAVLRR